MTSDLYQVEEYLTENGRNPFRAWLEGIKDKKCRAIIEGRIFRVQKGYLGDCKSVGKGVFELRIFFGPGYRVYFAMQEEKIIVILAGGDKKTQPMDIKRAQKYWAEFQEG